MWSDLDYKEKQGNSEGFRVKSFIALFIITCCQWGPTHVHTFTNGCHPCYVCALLVIKLSLAADSPALSQLERLYKTGCETCGICDPPSAEDTCFSRRICVVQCSKNASCPCKLWPPNINQNLKWYFHTTLWSWGRFAVWIRKLLLFFWHNYRDGWLRRA